MKIFQFILIILLYKCVHSVNLNNGNITLLYPDENINIRSNFQQGYDDQLCEKQFTELLVAFGNSDDWAIKFIDAWGKIPSGIFWGHMIDLGNFEECVNTKRPPENGLENLHSQYCLAKIPFSDLLPSSNKKLPRMDSVIGGIDFTKITLGVCVPASCSPNFLNIILKDIAENILKINTTPTISPGSCSIKEEIKFRVIDIFAIVFFSLIALIMLMSTIYDYWMRKSKKSPIEIFIAFSVLTNGEKLFKFPTEKSKNMIGCLNGIRCISIVWVVFGHTYYLAVFLPHINLISIEDWFKTPFSMFLQTATISVDSFFFLSGFLLSWVAFKEMDKTKGKLNIFLMYFHRYIRLTPILAVAILFSVSLLKYLGNGPFWNNFLLPTTQFCEDNWWTTILYINNYVENGKVCLGHTWYLSVDTQLYILSPLILIPAYKCGKKFLLPITIILGLLSIGCTIANIINYDFSIFITAPGGKNAKLRMASIYYPTHTRYAPWLVGIVGGYFMYQNRTKNIILSKIIVILGWLTASIIFAAIIFGPYPHVYPDNIATTIESAFYESLSRVSWSIALLWIVFACEKGYGGFVNSFLSYTFWQVFARITYSIYIIHMIIELINTGNTKTDTHFSNYDMMLRFWSDFGLTIIISIFTVLAFESPIIGIEKAIFRTRKTNNPSQSQSNILEPTTLFKSDIKTSLS